jgi:broad specificity phosphatase PhoE
MSMQDNDDQLEPEHQQLSPEVQALLRQGRKAQKEAEVLRSQLATEKKLQAVKDAGVPDHPARELVFRDYEGPLEADAIKAYAEKYGIVQSAPAATNATSDDEIAAQSRILSAGGGAPAVSTDVDLAVALRNAKSQAEVLAIVGQVAGTPGFRNRDGYIGELPTY